LETKLINKRKSSANTLAKTLIAITSVVSAAHSFAADGFRTHFATAGTLGENIFTSEIKPGGFAGLGYKRAVAEALTDSSGNEIKKAPNGLPLTYKNTASVQYIYAGYTAEEMYAGGNLSGIITVPFTTFDKNVTLTHPKAGSLNVPNSSGDVSGLDDIEIGGTWDYKKSADTKYSVGLGLTTKTGSYQLTSNGASIGQGYYTLKPSFASITQDGAMSYAYKATLGINTTNSDANYRSGNVLSLEAAIGYKTSVGAFGFRVHKLEQIQDDSGKGVAPTAANAFGLPLNGVTAPNADGNRIKYTTATLFYTAPISSIGSIFYLGLTAMSNPVNTTVPNNGYIEMRLTKAFN
jgi:hypothetical protein